MLRSPAPTGPGTQPGEPVSSSWGPPSWARAPLSAWMPGADVQIRLELCLPRADAGAVAVIRRVLDVALAALGVTDECRGDIALALTEACANAVAHAHLGDEYQVSACADADRCVIEVTDTGVGVDFGRVTAAPTADSGRGLQLIRACTDRMELRAVRPHGLTIRMTKMLTWESNAPLKHLGQYMQTIEA
jgi:serine/threonine-protein kinase RsbW